MSEENSHSVVSQERMPNGLSNLERVVASFAAAASKNYTMLEFWLDASVPRKAQRAPSDFSPSVFLVFHAFTQSGDLDAAIAKSNETGDPGFVYDVQGTVSDQTWFELAEVAQEWSTYEGLRRVNGEKALLDCLAALVRSDPAGAGAFARVFFHPVDDLSEIVWLKR